MRHIKRSGFYMPCVPMLTGAERQYVIVGAEVGWPGNPKLRSVIGQICFFSGRISTLDPETKRYLIDA